MQAENITDEATAFAVVDDLVIATQTETSLSPQDINNTISILTTIINFLSEETGMANVNKVSAPPILYCACTTTGTSICTSILARPMPILKDTVPFGDSNVPFRYGGRTKMCPLILAVT